ncbi:hypothetical protein NL676_026874 [Syzygium grande]|nr:hypothetical protein NL676_026874 [Syzygium grande]
MPEMEGKLISIDTFYSEVASEAVSKGAHIVNDVSAGTLDNNMIPVVADLKVPYVAMHMRGDPSTMQNRENLQYHNVCKQIASELFTRVKDAELSGIPAWRIIVDPGIGFSKNTEHNVDILVGLPAIREELARKNLALSHVPLLIGPSRKRFLGDICARPIAPERDAATVAAVTAGVLGGGAPLHSTSGLLLSIDLGEEIVIWARKKTGVPVIRINSMTEAEEFLKKYHMFAIGVFEKYKGPAY